MQNGNASVKFTKSQYAWAAFFGLVLILAGCLVFRSCSKKMEPVPEFVLEQESWYLPQGIEFAGTDAFDDGETEIVLVYGREKDGVYKNENGACFLRSQQSIIDAKGPVYQKNGAMVSFSAEADPYRVVYADFTAEEGAPQMQYTVAAAFDAQNQKINQTKVFLLGLTKYGAFLNSEKMQIIRGESVQEIEPNSVLVFGTSYMAVYRFNGHALEKKVLSVAGSTMVETTEFRVSYAEVLRFLTELESNPTPQPVSLGEMLEGNYAYYDLDIRFDVYGPSWIYRSADGIYLENETNYYTLHRAPLLENDEKYWWLPADYEVISLNGFSYRRVQAKSAIRPAAEQSACVISGEKEHYISECFFYDGKENYILPQETVITLPDRQVSISAFSCLTVKDSQSFAVFDFENNTYEVYFIKGTSPMISFPEFGQLDFMKHSFLHVNGRTDYLLSEPRILAVLE